MTSKPIAGAGTVVPFRQIEEELARQLNAVRGAGEAPVRQARMSNLVIFCDRFDTAEQLATEAPKIVAQHPARVLLLLAEEDAAEAELQSAVNAWCELGTTRQHICSEQITLRGRGQAAQRLPYCVRSLLIGDLPMNVWWAASVPPPMGGELMHELTDRAQQVLYDSIGWTDPPRAVAAVAGWLGKVHSPAKSPIRKRVVSDINWRRLKYWRRILAQALDPATAPGAIETITEVVIEHGPHAVVQAWELVSWMALRLRWRVQGGQVQPGTEIAWQVQAPHGLLRVRIKRLAEGPSDVRRVHLTCSFQNTPGALDITAEDGRLLKAIAAGVSATPRTLITTPQPLADLVARQLSDREPDALFYESMDVAKVFAESLL